VLLMFISIDLQQLFHDFFDRRQKISPAVRLQWYQTRIETA